jgi:hypothetical protein
MARSRQTYCEDRLPDKGEVGGSSPPRADADLGSLGDLVQLLAGRVEQEWSALVLFRIALNADSVRHSL